MGIITKMRKQTAVYWPLGSETTGGRDMDDYGKPLYSAAVEISCRWVDKAREFITPAGERATSRAEVYVDRDVSVKGVLFLGSLTDLTDVNNPKANVGAWEIRGFEKTPNLKATEFLRKAIL